MAEDLVCCSHIIKPAVTHHKSRVMGKNMGEYANSKGSCDPPLINMKHSNFRKQQKIWTDWKIQRFLYPYKEQRSITLFSLYKVFIFETKNKETNNIFNHIW